MKIAIIFTFCFIGLALARNVTWKDLKVTDSEVIKVTEQVMEVFNENDTGLYYKKSIEILSARRQNVNTKKYQLTVLVGQTYCLKLDAGAKLCDVPASAPKQKCVFMAYLEGGSEVAITSTSCSDV